uniref:Uncharacterized protein n=1 Tax=Manihot esculenta TaxID=3983 RepID=A0A2C9UZ07_MANES
MHTSFLYEYFNSANSFYDKNALKWEEMSCTIIFWRFYQCSLSTLITQIVDFKSQKNIIASKAIHK